MREILFRGKRLEIRDWAEGSLIAYPDGDCYIASHSGDPTVLDKFCADPTTIGQYTGLKDKNGKRIFEGDVLLVDGEDGHFTLSWDDDGARFVMDGDGLRVDFDNFWNYEVEVIGNIHDNQELLKGE